MSIQTAEPKPEIKRSFPPGPKVNPIMQMARFVLGASSSSPELLDDMGDWFETYGDQVGLSGLPPGYVMLCHPDDLYDVLLRKASSFGRGPDYTNDKWGLAAFLGSGLLVSDGEFWRRQRKLVQPAFHPRRIEAYADTMVAYTQRTLDTWHDGQQIYLDQAMSALTMEIVAKCLFNEEVSSVVERVATVMDSLQEIMTHPSPLPEWLPLPRHQRKKEAVRTLNEIVYGFLADWRKDRVDRGDLLSMLLLAADEDAQGMSDKQIRDELVTLLLAGHETTANALNWTFYLLTQHSDVVAKLQTEVDQVLGDRTATLADLDKLVYTRAIIEETLRLYPPAWSVSRMALEPVQIGDYQLEKGTLIGASIYSVHRDARWWDEPEAFRPERFLSPDPERPKYAYIPFGGGAHICIGNHFAMMEAQLLLATIAQRFTFDLLPEPAVVPMPMITLVPKDGVRVTLHMR